MLQILKVLKYKYFKVYKFKYKISKCITVTLLS